MSTNNQTNDDDSTLRTYLAEINRFKLLNSDEEMELAKRIEDDDREALNALVNANLRLVVKIAKSYVSSEMGLMDLIQEGSLGLMRAAERFDRRREVRFSTYASWWIKQAVIRALSTKRRTIRVPYRKEEAVRRLQKSSEAFAQEHFRKPNMEELASCSGMKEKDIGTAMRMVSGTVSLDSENHLANGSLHDVLEDHSYTPDVQLVRKSMEEDTRRVLDCLREQEKTILMYRYAFIGGEKHTLKAIAAKLGISTESVRQIEINALKKLRTQAVRVRDYLYN